MPWIDPKARFTGDIPRFSDDATPVVNIPRVEDLFTKPMSTGAKQVLVHILREDSILEEVQVVCETPTTNAAYGLTPSIQVHAAKYSEAIDLTDEAKVVALHEAVIIAGEGGLTANVPASATIDDTVSVLSAGTPIFLQSSGVLGSNGSYDVVEALGNGSVAVPIWTVPVGSAQDNGWFVTAIRIVSGGSGVTVAGDWDAGTLDLVHADNGSAPTYGVNSILTAPVELDNDESEFEIDTEELTNRLLGAKTLWAVYDSATIGSGTQLKIQLTIDGTTGPKNIHIQLRFKERAAGRGQ